LGSGINGEHLAHNEPVEEHADGGQVLLHFEPLHVYPVYTTNLTETGMLTRVFKSGNSLAVRIPKELAFAEAPQEVEIERIGNMLLVRPVAQQNFDDLVNILSSFPQSFMADGRDFHEQHDRDWPTLSNDES
jgi:antitoxin VapB